jgi:IS30 family transposase
MDDKTRRVLDETPDKPPRSKLEPPEDVIRELRRKGRTYEDIAQFFAVHLNLKVAPSTIYAFVRVRARRRQRVRTELPQVEHHSVPSRVEAASNDADVRQRIAELKRRRRAEEPKPRLFHYDENEPLHLIPKPVKETNH